MGLLKEMFYRDFQIEENELRVKKVVNLKCYHYLVFQGFRVLTPKC